MRQLQGFKTKKEAIAFRKVHGGMVCWEKRTPKKGRLTGCGIDYAFAVNYCWLDPEKYPYCVVYRKAEND